MIFERPVTRLVAAAALDPLAAYGARDVPDVAKRVLAFFMDAARRILLIASRALGLIIRQLLGAQPAELGAALRLTFMQFYQ